MSRYIDADALKDKLQQHHDFYVMAWGGFGKMPIGEKKRVDEITNCIAEVVNAPTIEPKRGEWVPCSERLPNEDEIPYDGIGREGERTVSDRILAIDKNGFIRIGYFMNAMDAPRFGKRYEFGEHYRSDPTNWIVGESCRRFDPIAWMPLPKPWKGADDETD